MLRARASNGTFILGLDAENIKRLMAGQPILVSLAEMGGTDDVLIMAGQTLQDIARELEEASGAPLPQADPTESGEEHAMNKPILCLDFDGVIHSYTSRWQGADVIPDPPVEGAIAFMLGALHHFDVVIFSSRSHQKGGIAAMQRWLREHAGQTWYETPAGPGLEDVRFVTEKPPAMVTLDDRAITFTGTFPDPRGLLSFKPWNKP